MKSINVFVYGTLMKDYWNHHYLKGQRYIGSGTISGYEMYHVSTYPGIVPKEGSYIKGELYEVDKRTLEKLDQLEGEGFLYKRTEVEVQLHPGEEKIKAYVYVWLKGVKNMDKVEEMPWKPRGRLIK